MHLIFVTNDDGISSPGLRTAVEPDSVSVYKLLEKLQLEALQTGGSVVRLLGNHELALLQGYGGMTDVNPGTLVCKKKY